MPGGSSRPRSSSAPRERGPRVLHKNTLQKQSQSQQQQQQQVQRTQPPAKLNLQSLRPASSAQPNGYSYRSNDGNGSNRYPFNHNHIYQCMHKFFHVPMHYLLYEHVVNKATPPPALSTTTLAHVTSHAHSHSRALASRSTHDLHKKYVVNNAHYFAHVTSHAHSRLRAHASRTMHYGSDIITLITKYINDKLTIAE